MNQILLNYNIGCCQFRIIIFIRKLIFHKHATERKIFAQVHCDIMKKCILDKIKFTSTYKEKIYYPENMYKFFEVDIA